jgi:hypothetical protein
MAGLGKAGGLPMTALGKAGSLPGTLPLNPLLPFGNLPLAGLPGRLKYY